MIQLNIYQWGREPWSSDYGRRLTFQRSWVRIPAPYTGWTFFHIYLLYKFVMFVWKRPKINEKEVGVGPFFKNIYQWITCFISVNKIFSPCDEMSLNWEEISYWCQLLRLYSAQGMCYNLIIREIRVAAIAPWFHLRLPSCGPGFESQAHHQCFIQFVLKL